MLSTQHLEVWSEGKKEWLIALREYDLVWGTTMLDAQQDIEYISGFPARVIRSTEDSFFVLRKL